MGRCRGLLMERNFQVIDLIDQTDGHYLGQAIYCAERGECPFFKIGSRLNSGEVFEAFLEGAKQVGGNINLYHINMPIEINSRNTPYNEIRNTIVGEMEMRTTRVQNTNSQNSEEIKEEVEIEPIVLPDSAPIQEDIEENQG